MARVRTRSWQDGFSLIELLLVVTIVGVLATLAVYGVKRYLSHAKGAEARSSVGQMGKGAKAAFERETMEDGFVAQGQSTRIVHNLCTSAEHPVPVDIASVKARKYQSAPSDWSGSGDARVGFSCLQFTMTDPQYYQYNYQGTAGAHGTFTASAQGDLDGDGTLSRFAVHGAVQNGSLYVSPSIEESNPEE